MTIQQTEPSTTISTVDAAVTQVRHLVDSDVDAVLPYVSVGHHPKGDPAASPVVRSIFAASVETLAHPYNGRPAAVVTLTDGRDLIVAVDRIAHLRGCVTCEPIWVKYEALVDGLPDDGMLSALGEVDTSRGAMSIIVDAIDLDIADSDEADADA
ncbi:hypothetical protein KZI27_00990 (plasmid) [Curtobacterium sp. TC1]|uniref:hypothetical protein n=1 Tax=Curtobacterium sp. TC1 TaxID=2862880 RepID=UPI001C9B961E|nr:hypothetical protein [Curtobacterium sp. TC1]QZQ53751.1 hypothetical protein KZI27_00990 [Curtobacterium sp. TC1]